MFSMSKKYNFTEDLLLQFFFQIRCYGSGPVWNGIVESD